jgi:hypothetical protein
MTTVIKLDDTLNMRVTFSLVNMPDNDYDIEVAQLIFETPEGKHAYLTDYDHDGQREILDLSNAVVDAYIDANHGTIYAQLTTPAQRQHGYLH